MTPAEIAAGLEVENRGATLLVAEAQCSDLIRRPRFTVLRVEASCVCAVWDGSIAADERDALVRELGRFATVWRCQSDAMARTPWRKAWTLPPAPFRLFTGRGMQVAVDGDLLRMRRWPRGTVPIAAGEIGRVEVTLSADWVTRAVVLVRKDGRRVHVAGDADPFAALDPTYDGSNLLLDASWARSLGASLAKALGVELRLPPEI